MKLLRRLSLPLGPPSLLCSADDAGAAAAGGGSGAGSGGGSGEGGAAGAGDSGSEGDDGASGDGAGSDDSAAAASGANEGGNAGAQGDQGANANNQADENDWRARAEAAEARAIRAEEMATKALEASTNLRETEREKIIEQAKVLDGYQSLVPDFDATTAKGRKDFEAWFEAHPEILEKKPASPEAGGIPDFDERVKNLRSPHLANTKMLQEIR